MLKQVLEVTGVDVEVRKILVESEQEARALRFVSSATIRVNGRDIAPESKESKCGSCSELAGQDTSELGALAEVMPLDETASPAELRSELAACLAPMIDRLTGEYRQSIVLTEFEGVRQSVAARQLGLSVSGMKSRVQRARQRLKAMLLECCRVELDRRSGIVDYQEVRGASCGACNPEEPLNP